MHGRVVRSTGSWYDVRTDEGLLIPCKVKGNFRLRGLRTTNPVAVGDGVTITDDVNVNNNDDDNDNKRRQQAHFITEIDERRNYIIRRASNLSKQSHILAANIDQVLLMVTVARPETTTTFIDRFLASAEAYRVPVILAFNKQDDLRTPEERELASYLQLLYSHIGYRCIALSALNLSSAEKSPLSDEGEGGLAFLQGATTLLAGHSGVGKSTLLNALIPEAGARTAAISEAHGSGQHTTTYSELYELPGGGALIDVPGIKGFGTFDMEREELGHYFREIFEAGQECRFSNCTHTHEPGCAVREALENHRIAPSRYTSYLSMLEDKDENRYRNAE